MFAAARDDDLGGLVSQSVLALEFGGDGLAQFGDAAAGSVFGEPGGERLGGGVLDMLRRVEIRFARAEPDDVLARGLHGLGLGVNGQRERWRQRRGALRNFVIHNSSAKNLQIARRSARTESSSRRLNQEVKACIIQP